MKTEERGCELKNENQWWSAQSALNYPMLLSFAFTPSTASLLSPSFRPGRVRFATFAPWCLALISCCSASWCLSAGLVLDCASPLAVHGPGFAFQGHPLLGYRPFPSLRACIWTLDSLGASRTFQGEDAVMWGGSTTAVWLCIQVCSLCVSFLACFACCFASPFFTGFSSTFCILSSLAVA